MHVWVSLSVWWLPDGLVTEELVTWASLRVGSQWLPDGLVTEEMVTWLVTEEMVNWDMP